MAFQPLAARQKSRGMRLWMQELKNRPRMLKAGLTCSVLLLLLEGALAFLGALFFQSAAFMRNHPLVLPSQLSLGATLLALSFFLARFSVDPRRESLAVDALILLFVLRTSGLLWIAKDVPEFFWSEKAFWTLEALAAAWLLIYRTRSSELAGEPEAPAEAGSVLRNLWRYASAWWSGPRPPRPGGI